MRTQRGFTLIETVIFIIVMGLALGGIVSLFVQSAIGGRYPFDQQRAIALANTYMDEILRKRWDEGVPLGGGCVATGSGYCPGICALKVYPVCGTCLLNNAPPGSCVAPAAVVPPAAPGPEPGEGRAAYDDIDDYNGLVDAPPVDSTGAPIPGYAGYSVAVAVTNPAAPWNGVPAADTKQIVVTVSLGVESYALTAYRVNY